jgi:FKBP-type peptidyl-prolyl cis-trans isomerase
MEKKINKKIEQYLSTFKENIRDKLSSLSQQEDKDNILLQYIYDYDRLMIEKEDLAKRKRVKNVVPYFERCCAKKATGEQCTRRRKSEADEFCGTHMKGVTHGVMEEDTGEEETKTKQIEVWAQDIQGIVQYIDNMGNVYQAEDIVNNVTNPKIVAKYTKEGDHYSIT